MRYTFLLAFGFVFAACQASDAPEAATPTSSFNGDSMLAIYERLYGTGVGDSLAKDYTEDGVHVYEGMQASGRSEIAQFFGAAPGMTRTMDLDKDSEWASGDLAVMEGTFTTRVTPQGAAEQTQSGRWLSVYRHDDGVWRAHRIVAWTPAADSAEAAAN
jgi:ketosteroid isomerase-like protein